MRYIPQIGFRHIPLLLCALALCIGGCEYENPTASSEPQISPGDGETGGSSFGAQQSVSASAEPEIEGDSGASILVVSLEVAPRPVGRLELSYVTKPGSADEGTDYERAKGTLVFEPGQSSQSIAVTILGDLEQEDDEVFSLKLHSPAPVSISPSEIALQIIDDDTVTSGLTARPANPGCVAPPRPTLDASIDVTPAFPDLSAFVKPVALLQAPGDSGIWYVVEQDGRVRKFENTPDVSSVSTFVDMRGNGTAIDVDSSALEEGLLGMAFHPAYGSDNYSVFLSYTVNSSGTDSVVARFESLDNGATLDADSAGDATELLRLDQPYNNHNGGNIAFGPDGYLYVGFGDGGSGGDPGDRAQNTQNLFGSMVRIDVDGEAPYGIPSDNPFAPNPRCADGTGSQPCPEIYAWGFRNPWRWSFDEPTGDLWLGDVGQVLWEEIDIVELGGNYGWRCREGAHDYNTNGNCPDGLIDPVIEYSGTAVGDAVTGGVVYRGSGIPALQGRYIFADYSRGKIFASVDQGDGTYGFETLLDTDYFISSFALDENGELLFLDLGGGRIYRVVASGGGSSDTIPSLLSESGCVDPANPSQPAAGVIPYDINVPFWSDGAVKERFYAIPDGTSIDVDNDGDWLFPNGTVLMKHFRLNGSLFETRLFMRHPDGTWAGYTYEWDESGADATRVIGGKSADVEGQPWTYPSESECMSCHTQSANFSLGIEHGQLNRGFTYPSTGLTANQLTTADEVDLLTEPLSEPPGNLPRYSNPDDGSASLVERARAYLHSNCSGCHRPLGPTPSSMDLRESTEFALTNTCNAQPSGDMLGIPGAKILVPGDATASLIVQRPNRRDVHGMPPLASAFVDVQGVALLEQWVGSISECPQADWQGSDIGNVSAQGSYVADSTVFTISASGSDIYGTVDEFFYVFRPLSGDGEIVARVESLIDTNEWAKAGLMIRESVSPQSTNAFMIATPDRGAGLQWRIATGGQSDSNAPGSGHNSLTAPIWLKLIRQGDVFTGYHSTDGIDWTQSDQVSISMANDVLVGLAVTSHNDGTLTRAVIDNVSVVE